MIQSNSPFAVVVNLLRVMFAKSNNDIICRHFKLNVTVLDKKLVLPLSADDITHISITMFTATTSLLLIFHVSYNSL